MYTHAIKLLYKRNITLVAVHVYWHAVITYGLVIFIYDRIYF